MIVRKSITIKDKHEKWLNENAISLSRLIQKVIDDRMKKEGYEMKRGGGNE